MTDADHPRPPSRSGMMPPDGVAWPPEPQPQQAPPEAPSSLPSTPRRPVESEVLDWRTMPFDGPEGYRGSATAPRSTPRWDPWCIAALVCGLAGFAAVWLPRGILFVPALGLAFGLTGRRATMLDPSLKGRWMATVGVVAAVAVGVIVGVDLAVGG